MRAPDLILELPCRRPYHLEGLLEFLAARAVPGVESVGGGRYRRTGRIGARAGVVEVGRARSGGLEVRAWGVDAGDAAVLAARIERLFALAADPAPVAARLGRDPDLAALVAAAPGLRVPGAWSGFELAVRAVVGQQVSVAGASTLAGRLVAAHGRPLPRALRAVGAPHGLHAVFPSPGRLAGGELAGTGLTGARARTLTGLARAVRAGTLDLERDLRGGGEGLAACLAALQRIPGIGPWTAHYVAMRAWGAPDAFPSSDLVLRRVLAPPGRPLSARALEARAEPWRPWRAYAAMHLWRAGARASR